MAISNNPRSSFASSPSSGFKRSLLAVIQQLIAVKK